jgi:hypothetical protein
LRRPLEAALHAAVGVVDQATGAGLPGLDRHVKRGGRQTGLQMGFQSPAHDPPAIGIQDDRQVGERLLCAKKGVGVNTECKNKFIEILEAYYLL